MARLGKQIAPSLHGRFARPAPDSFCSDYPLANSFSSESVPSLSPLVWQIEGGKGNYFRKTCCENESWHRVVGLIG